MSDSESSAPSREGRDAARVRQSARPSGDEHAPRAHRPPAESPTGPMSMNRPRDPERINTGNCADAPGACAALILHLPWPPSVNHYWRSIPLRGSGHGFRAGRGCRVVISREGRAYRKNVCALLRDQSSSPPDGRLHVRVVLQPPTRRAIDIDNRMKALLDSLEHARIYHDDGQIDRLEIERGEVIKGGRAIVEIVELPS